MPYLPIQRIMNVIERRAIWVFGEVQNNYSPFAIQSTIDDLRMFQRYGKDERPFTLIADGELVRTCIGFENLMRGNEAYFPFIWECAPATVIYGLNCDLTSGYKTADSGHVMLDNTRRYVSSGQSPHFSTTPDFPYLFAYNGKNAYLIGRNGMEILK